jgi:hypothetical protein
MLLATNRNLVTGNFKNGVGNEGGFGEEVSEKGPTELRFARVTRPESGWKLALVAEPQALDPENLPSRAEFEFLAKRCIAGKKHCIFYIHGYNKPFVETLEQAWLIQERYGVEVVLFSWPSNTGGPAPVEYRQARRVAQSSFSALDSLLEKYGRYLKEWMTPMDEAALLSCGSTTNLISHSLGNYLLEHYVLSTAYQAETRLFTNLVLSQADVNSVNHIKWVDQIVVGQRAYVTINEKDGILKWSESINPPRLGRTLANLESKKALYFDFTGGKGVGNKHQLWGEVNNAAVKNFFQLVLTGERGEDATGFEFDPKYNAYRIK